MYKSCLYIFSLINKLIDFEKFKLISCIFFYDRRAYRIIWLIKAGISYYRNYSYFSPLFQLNSIQDILHDVQHSCFVVLIKFNFDVDMYTEIKSACCDRL